MANAKSKAVSAVQQNAVMADRLMQAYEARGDAMDETSTVIESLVAVATLAGEYAHQADDGPGKVAKQRAIVVAISTISRSASAQLQAVHDSLDGLCLDDPSGITASDVAELKAKGGEHGKN